MPVKAAPQTPSPNIFETTPMSNMIEDTKAIQRELGLTVDGRYGPVTAANVLAALLGRHADPQVEQERPARVSSCTLFDARTEANLETLDPKAVPMARQFLCLAKATAATMGCDVIVISGNRSYAEQNALFAKGRNSAGKVISKKDVVTNARGGQSNHNFRIAFDVGIFLGKVYLDDGTKEQQLRASKVHKAISEAAAECGLEWGGSWTSIVDQPHYQVRTGKTTAQLRALYDTKGSVL